MNAFKNIEFAGYENARSTQLLATSCLCCGRALRDAVSVECGVGPVCRENNGYDMSSPHRDEANALIHEAAYATNDRVIDIVGELEALGFTGVAAKITKRFLKPAVEICEKEVTFGKGKYSVDITAVVVSTAWSPEFTEELKSQIDWRDRALVRNEAGKFEGWAVKPEAKRALWSVIKDHFGGEMGVGPKGSFTI